MFIQKLSNNPYVLSVNIRLTSLLKQIIYLKICVDYYKSLNDQIII